MEGKSGGGQVLRDACTEALQDIFSFRASDPLVSLGLESKSPVQAGPQP